MESAEDDAAHGMRQNVECFRSVLGWWQALGDESRKAVDVSTPGRIPDIDDPKARAAEPAAGQSHRESGPPEPMEEEHGIHGVMGAPGPKRDAPDHLQED